MIWLIQSSDKFLRLPPILQPVADSEAVLTYEGNCIKMYKE